MSTMGLPSWAVESWVEYAVASVTILVRIGVRTKVVGWRGWQGDDFLVFATLFFLNLTLVSFYLNYVYPTNQGLTNAVANEMTDLEIYRMRIGSIWNFVGWAAYMSLVWSCKGCMLFLYSRLTIGLWQRKLVTIAWYLVIVTYISNWIAMLLKCQPIQKNWQIKPAPGFCVMGLTNMYAIGITNLVTDLIIFAIPLPLIARVNLPLKKKFLIFLVLCSGVFIIIATTIRMVFTILTITGKISDNLGFMLGWATRENFTSVMIVNVPIVFTALRRCISKDPSSIASQKQWRSRTRTASVANERRIQQAALKIERHVSFDVNMEEIDLEDGASESSLRLKPLAKAHHRPILYDDDHKSEASLDLGPGHA